MGKSQSKLTPEQISELQNSTHCEPYPDLHPLHPSAENHFLQLTSRNSRPGEHLLPMRSHPLYSYVSLPVPICHRAHTGTRTSCETTRMSASTRRKSSASTSGSSPLVTHANSWNTFSASLTVTTTELSTSRSSSALSLSHRVESPTTSSSVHSPSLPLRL